MNIFCAYNHQNSEPGMNNTNDLFCETLRYDAAPYDIDAQYNGNIASVSWFTANDLKKIKRYTYQYQRNMLKNAAYSEDFTCMSDCATNQYNEHIDYSSDGNGNIENIYRTGFTGLHPTTSAPTFALIDGLSYRYKGNQLKNVDDGVVDLSASINFNDGTTSGTAVDEYSYDANGSMTSDANKGITAIEYNILNLPSKITFATTGSIEFIYDATGQKLQKKVKDGSGTVLSTKYYLGSEEYTNNVLEAYYNDEGRLTPKPGDAWQYEYTLEDHLGNGRVYFADLNNNGSVDAATELLQVQDYYPFGLQHSGTGAAVSGVQDMHQYNGKEFNDELGLNWNDYGARFYDAAIILWTSIDPLAAKHFDYNPKAYVINNPILRLDPKGLTDFTFSIKTGEVKQVGQENKNPDRIVKTKLIGKHKGEVKYKKNGDPRSALENIEKGILQNGQNFKNNDVIITVGGNGQPSVEGVKSFTLKLSEYIGREIKGFTYSSNGSSNVTDILLGNYEDNSTIISFASPQKLNQKYENFSFNNIVQQFHTHLNGELGATQSAPHMSTDVKRRDKDKMDMTNASFIILYRINGEEKPGEFDYTH